MEKLGTLKCTYTAFDGQKGVLYRIYFETHLLVASYIYMDSLLLWKASSSHAWNHAYRAVIYMVHMILTF